MHLDKTTEEARHTKMMRRAFSDMLRIVLSDLTIEELTKDFVCLSKLKHGIDSGVDYDYSLFPSPAGVKLTSRKIKKSQKELSLELEALESSPDLCIWDDEIKKEVWVRPSTVSKINTHKTTFKREVLFCKNIEEFKQSVLESLKHASDRICLKLSFAAEDETIEKTSSELMKYMEIAVHNIIEATEAEVFEFVAFEASERAREAASTKHEKSRDIKQKAKAIWLEWQEDKEMFKSKADFARYVLKAFADEKGNPILKDDKNIKDVWCKEWETEKQHRSA